MYNPFSVGLNCCMGSGAFITFIPANSYSECRNWPVYVFCSGQTFVYCSWASSNKL